MAKVYITEHKFIVGQIGQLLNISEMPPIASQTVNVTGSSVQSAAFNSQTEIVSVHTDVVCSIEFGSNPTATSNSKRMAANATEYFKVTPGHRVAVITNT